MADDLNEKNVQFKWQDQNNCLIIITERDNRGANFSVDSQLKIKCSWAKSKPTFECVGYAQKIK
jgi:hypothetical protein